VGIFTNKNIISLSHNDLDGVSCQIILLDHYLANTHQCNYGGTLEQLRYLKKELHNYDVLLITDLILTSANYDYIKQLSVIYPKLNIHWIDHHYQSLEINISDIKYFNNIFLHLDTELCATKILYNLIKEFNNYSEYVEKINAFDLWLTDSIFFDGGMWYNTLFWNYKAKSYFNQFKKLQTRGGTIRQQKDYDKIVVEKDKYFKDLESRGLVLSDDGITVVFGDLHQNWSQINYPSIFNIQVFSFGKIVVKISKGISEQQAKQISEYIIHEINQELLLNVGGHFHILSLTHSGNMDYSVIIDYTKKIYGYLKEYKLNNLNQGY
jgi:hypothetical protein